MLRPDLTDWRSQYDRMTRSYERLRARHDSSIAYDDDLAHYFQDCWHLRDWIRNDPKVPDAVKNETTRDVDASTVLQIAADLANASKHYVRNYSSAYVTSKSVTVHLGQDQGANVSHNIILTDGTKVTAEAVARDAYEAWQLILRNWNLI